MPEVMDMRLQVVDTDVDEANFNATVAFLYSGLLIGEDGDSPISRQKSTICRIYDELAFFQGRFYPPDLSDLFFAIDDHNRDIFYEINHLSILRDPDSIRGIADYLPSGFSENDLKEAIQEAALEYSDGDMQYIDYAYGYGTVTNFILATIMEFGLVLEITQDHLDISADVASGCEFFLNDAQNVLLPDFMVPAIADAIYSPCLNDELNIINNITVFSKPFDESSLLGSGATRR